MGLQAESIEFIPVEKVAKELKTTHRKVVLMIKNGTLPIGAVAEPDGDRDHYVCKILKSRWEKYKTGEL